MLLSEDEPSIKINSISGSDFTFLSEFILLCILEPLFLLIVTIEIRYFFSSKNLISKKVTYSNLYDCGTNAHLVFIVIYCA